MWRRNRPGERRGTILLTAVLLLLLTCVAGALWTAYWSLRFGLAPRSPLSPLQTGARIAIVLGALILLRRRRDWLERTALLLTAIAAACSALFGFGLRSPLNDASRLLFHFLAYVLGAVVLIRWLTDGNQNRTTT